METLTVREISSGIAFLVSLVFWGMTIHYLIVGRKRRLPTPGTAIGTRAAMALSVFLFGFVLRAGYAWAATLTNVARDWTNFVLVPSSALIILGGVFCIHVFYNRGFGRGFEIAAVVLAVALPVIVHLFL